VVSVYHYHASITGTAQYKLKDCVLIPTKETPKKHDSG